MYESAADLESRERRSRLFRRNELLLRVLTGAVLPWEESAAPQLADHGIAFFESPSALFSLLFLRVDRPEESLARYAGEEREAVLAPESAPLGFSARYGTLLTLAGRLFVAGENAVLDSVDNEYVLPDERQKQNLLEALRAGSFERAAQAYRAISDDAARRSLENIMNVYL